MGKLQGLLLLPPRRSLRYSLFFFFFHFSAFLSLSPIGCPRESSTYANSILFPSIEPKC